MMDKTDEAEEEVGHNSKYASGARGSQGVIFREYDNCIGWRVTRGGKKKMDIRVVFFGIDSVTSSGLFRDLVVTGLSIYEE